MNSVEGARVLSERVVPRRDEQDPEIVHVIKQTYVAGTHLEIPGSKPIEGWTGEETLIEEEVITHVPIKLKPGGLLWHCAWGKRLVPPEPPLPVPEGFTGYTSGICPEHKHDPKQRLWPEDYDLIKSKPKVEV